MNSNNFIGLITRCKDEYFIAEFVEYYLSQGIDHIYIIDDNSSNKSIYDNIDNMKVTIYYENNIIKNDYASILYSDIKKQYEWIIYVDVDEFITTRKHISNTIRDELLTTFKNVDCIKIPWVMMSCNGIKESPERLLTTNIQRWNHDKKHPNKLKKLRCRYKEIEVKCIFKPKFFDEIYDHHPKQCNKENPLIVNAIDCSDSSLSPFIENLREQDIENGFLLCYHYRIISIDNCINKLKTSEYYKGYFTLDQLMSCDYNEVKDETLKDKSIKLKTMEKL